MAYLVVPALLAAAMLLPVPSLYARVRATADRICVHLYNRAQVPERSVNQAVVLISRTFRKAGVEIEWQVPALDSREAYVLDMNMHTVEGRPSSPCLVIRLTKNIQDDLYTGALGFSLPSSAFGVNCEIFINRVEATARMTALPDSLVLGETIIHEMGHVLLRSADHSAAGIMQQHWNSETWRLASCGMLRFLPSELKAIHAGAGRFRSATTLLTPMAN